MANTLATAGDGKVVTIHYTLRDDDGDVIDTSDGSEPLEYLHGAGNIVPGLETAMVGKAVGDKFKVTVSPAEGYGEVKGEPRPVPRNAFPDDADIEPGSQFFVRGQDGEPFPVWVAGFDGEDVLIDPNHPLAGENLHFEIEVTAIRDASKEEVEHGHPHGPGDHHHH
jgi:FKBP-type peptidyl-prolyl cis-trans isomerase SlyD